MLQKTVKMMNHPDYALLRTSFTRAVAFELTGPIKEAILYINELERWEQPLSLSVDVEVAGQVLHTWHHATADILRELFPKAIYGELQLHEPFSLLKGVDWSRVSDAQARLHDKLGEVYPGISPNSELHFCRSKKRIKDGGRLIMRDGWDGKGNYCENIDVTGMYEYLAYATDLLDG